MKPTKKQLQEMYNYAKELYDWITYNDIYDLKRIYSDISDEFWLDIEFWIDWNQDWWDDEIYCYIYMNWIGSIVFNWSCTWYNNEDEYKNAVDYLLKLNDEGNEIVNKILTFNQK